MVGGGKLLLEGVAERGNGVGARRMGEGGWDKGGGIRGVGQGGKGGGIYIKIKFSTKQVSLH